MDARSDMYGYSSRTTTKSLRPQFASDPAAPARTRLGTMLRRRRHAPCGRARVHKARRLACEPLLRVAVDDDDGVIGVDEDRVQMSGMWIFNDSYKA